MVARLSKMAEQLGKSIARRIFAGGHDAKGEAYCSAPENWTV
ncbi:hypothetical protein FLP41_03045 (plasmid) [Paracoccus marcusii]|nr:hypothetical protein FLP41_03045 [Paracoccus marcusii]